MRRPLLLEPRTTFPTAETALTKAIQSDASNSAYFQNRAAVRVQRENFSGALADINSALGLDPTSQELAIDRFNILQAMGNLQGALDSYQQWAQANGVWNNDLPFS